MKKMTLSALLVSLGIASGATAAENTLTGDISVQNTPKWTEYRGVPMPDSHHLNRDVIAFKLLELGYDNFAGYEVDQGLWKVTADKNGERLNVWVNPFFGHVVREKPIS